MHEENKIIEARSEVIIVKVFQDKACGTKNKKDIWHRTQRDVIMMTNAVLIFSRTYTHTTH